MTELLSAYGSDIKIHSLGDGNTKRLLALDMAGIYSNDTTTHFIAAATGKAVMPFIGTVYLDDVSAEGWKGICQGAGHRCAFCDDFTLLKKDLVWRKIHNLLVYRDLEAKYEYASKEDLSNDFYYLKQEELF